MNKPHQPAPSSPLLGHCPATLPAGAYYDPDHFARELKTIWARNWIYAGRAHDMTPMSMRRLTVAGDNLILVKDAQGAFTCFHNTCRHRGAELCATPEKRLKSKLISCPYHGWTYDLTGRLVRTPFVSMTADFRKEEHGLFDVAVMEWNGFVFVCLSDGPPEFSGVPDPAADGLNNWPMRDLVTGHVMVKEIACNWKIFWENYNECLHCPGIHPELSDMVPVYGRGYMAANEAPDWTPDTPPPAHGLKDGARTWSMTGALCGPPFSELTPEQLAAGSTFVTLLPTMFVVAHADYVRAVSLRPLGPERTELRAEFLFPPETLQAPGFDLDDVVSFATTVMLQDGEACEINQRGLRSSRYRHGTLMPQEFEVHRFHEWVRRHDQD
ncbi:aromatic ring-hydroxylating dioxygenase subunit alpha [Nordella sp. HKS 07]|uniref:aromatic ring-hydroxylating oxygenase subunit alpha n=1 Tax=Nordella sp. HKS 07 TaxID=2712222 RepID=UPI0013E12355|nr:aromatic ring-hydroxylating dioxygenase subunit alpha [Nordella sp. HKS 07]QIG46634.1 aromatic ring-hydroxylating dioxygenase subunit alpha [Nordella sp. HKS 07]